MTQREMDKRMALIANLFLIPAMGLSIYVIASHIERMSIAAVIVAILMNLLPLKFTVAGQLLMLSDFTYEDCTWLDYVRIVLSIAFFTVAVIAITSRIM